MITEAYCHCDSLHKQILEVVFIIEGILQSALSRKIQRSSNEVLLEQDLKENKECTVSGLHRKEGNDFPAKGTACARHGSIK